MFHCKISRKVSAQCGYYQNSFKDASFYICFVLFKENSSSDNGLQASEDEGAARSVQEDDPGKEYDADSLGTTDHTTKLLDDAPPKSALKHTPARRQPSLTRGQCCNETSTCCVVVCCSQKNCDPSNATRPLDPANFNSAFLSFLLFRTQTHLHEVKYTYLT